MADQPSAQIIPFPPRIQPPEQPQDGADRLARALASLDAALAEQRNAVASWRNALSDLQVTMQSLGDSARRYHDHLGNLGDDVAGLNAKARALESWADAALAGDDVSPEPSR